jgi:hypothetical protein
MKIEFLKNICPNAISGDFKGYIGLLDIIKGSTANVLHPRMAELEKLIQEGYIRIVEP